MATISLPDLRSPEMMTILLTEHEDTAFIRLRPIRVRDRLGVRLHSQKLDRALGRGAPPDSSVALSLHARRLISPRVRRGVARQLRALPTEAARPTPARVLSVPICRRRVLQAVETLGELADRLVSPEPVDARGVAQLRILLSDGQSPLFDPGRGHEFQSVLDEAVDALECCGCR